VGGSFRGVEQIQNGDRCHGNQGAKNVKVQTVQQILLKLDKKYIITQSCALCY
jgi:hypothetical protein